MKSYKIYYGYMGLEFSVKVKGPNNKDKLIAMLLEQQIIKHRGHINKIELAK